MIQNHPKSIGYAQFILTRSADSCIESFLEALLAGRGHFTATLHSSHMLQSFNSINDLFHIFGRSEENLLKVKFIGVDSYVRLEFRRGVAN